MNAKYIEVPAELRGKSDPDDLWIKAQLIRIDPSIEDHDTEHSVAQAMRKLVLEQRDKLESYKPLADRAKYILVEAEVRYWEDATVNGQEDHNGTLIPCREGDLWKPVIRLEDGQIMGWPEGTKAEIHYKVCDQGEYFLGNDKQEKIGKWGSYYVPNEFLCHGDNGYGDYIIFNVDPDGKIKNWKRPSVEEDKDDENGRWTKLMKVGA